MAFKRSGVQFPLAPRPKIFMAQQFSLLENRRHIIGKFEKYTKKYYQTQKYEMRSLFCIFKKQSTRGLTWYVRF